MDEKDNKTAAIKAQQILTWLESASGRQELKNQVTRDSKYAEEINKATDVTIRTLMRAFTA